MIKKKQKACERTNGVDDDIYQGKQLRSRAEELASGDRWKKKKGSRRRLLLLFVDRKAQHSFLCVCFSRQAVIAFQNVSLSSITFTRNTQLTNEKNKSEPNWSRYELIKSRR